MLWQAFRDSSGLSVVIKAHPASSIDDIRESISFDKKKNVFIFEKNKSLDELLKESRALIVTGSSASLDGLALKCPVIIPLLSETVDMNPLSWIGSEFAHYVSNIKELVDIIETLINSENAPYGIDKAADFINNYFTLSLDENEYFNKLKDFVLN